MPIKMNELVKQTSVSKSTILFYIKEGLLPPPHKPKPNLHLYEESCIEIIKFIKYLQSNFDSSISEIKTVVKNGKFDFEKGFETVLETLHIIMGPIHQETYTMEQIQNKYNISSEKLKSYIKDGLLFQRNNLFTTKDIEILDILLNIEKLNVDKSVLKSYIKYAQKLAKIEVSFAKDFLNNQSNKNDSVKALFDMTLILKPYLFNMHTLNEYQKNKDTK